MDLLKSGAVILAFVLLLLAWVFVRYDIERHVNNATPYQSTGTKPDR